jgi:tetratricopeptide (TPR) repeat protein
MSTERHSPIDERPDLESGVAHHRAGRLDAARACYERALATNPRNVQALDLLGVVHAFQGRAEESIAALRHAVNLAPDFAPALNHLGLVLKSRKRLDDAVSCFRRAIAAAPHLAEAHVNLGTALLEQGRADDAIASFGKGIEAAPDSAVAHNNLGTVLFGIGKVGDALASFRRAVALDPRYAEAHRNLGRALDSLGMSGEAEGSYRHAIAINPRYVEAHKNLGEMFSNSGRYDESATHFRRALEIEPAYADLEHKLGIALARNSRHESQAEAPQHFAKAEALARAAITSTPDDSNAWETLGNALLRLGRTDDAFAARARAAAIVRNPGPGMFNHLATFRRTSKSKLDHDIEQIRHLGKRGIVKAADEVTLLTAYETVRERLPEPKGGARLVELDAPSRRLIGDTYNRLWHVAAAPELAGGAVNSALDRGAIEADYRERAPGITWLDGLLTPEALASLRTFCLESTVWFTDTYANGYLGAFAEDGFVCPLLLQIGRELPQRLPGIFGNHPLLKVWAFKYGANPDGIALHADFAAINVNFWITPDEANLDNDSGGLIVWDKEAPADWDFSTYNLDQRTLTQYIAESGATAHRVPHRQNRAVIFNSDLIHRTDEIRFRPGYENRRINVTFLYGERTGRI